MSKKAYFYENLGFGNMYNLFYAETPTEIEILSSAQNMERITRREAERYCAIENHARKYDSQFAYAADNFIYPIEFYTNKCLCLDVNPVEHPIYYTKGYLVLRGKDN